MSSAFRNQRAIFFVPEVSPQSQFLPEVRYVFELQPSEGQGGTDFPANLRANVLSLRISGSQRSVFLLNGFFGLKQMILAETAVVPTDIPDSFRIPEFCGNPRTNSSEISCSIEWNQIVEYLGQHIML